MKLPKAILHQHTRIRQWIQDRLDQYSIDLSQSLLNRTETASRFSSIAWQILQRYSDEEISSFNSRTLEDYIEKYFLEPMYQIAMMYPPEIGAKVLRAFDLAVEETFANNHDAEEILSKKVEHYTKQNPGKLPPINLLKTFTRDYLEDLTEHSKDYEGRQAIASHR